MFDGKIEEITERTGELLDKWRLGKTEALPESENSGDEIPMDYPSDLEPIIGKHAEEADIALRAWGWIGAGETWKDLSAERIASIKAKPKEFMSRALEVAAQIGRGN